MRSNPPMDGLFTPNFESDADRIAPILARHGGIAAALYYWLHSRVFACGNNIGISISSLAKELGVNRSSVQKAVKDLESEGLIAHRASRGNGGGSTFKLIGLSELKQIRTTSLNDAQRHHFSTSNDGASPYLIPGDLNITKTGDSDGHGKRERTYGKYDL